VTACVLPHETEQHLSDSRRQTRVRARRVRGGFCCRMTWSRLANTLPTLESEPTMTPDALEAIVRLQAAFSKLYDLSTSGADASATTRAETRLNSDYWTLWETVSDHVEKIVRKFVIGTREAEVDELVGSFRMHLHDRMVNLVLSKRQPPIEYRTWKCSEELFWYVGRMVMTHCTDVVGRSRKFSEIDDNLAAPEPEMFEETQDVEAAGDDPTAYFTSQETAWVRAQLVSHYCEHLSDHSRQRPETLVTVRLAIAGASNVSIAATLQQTAVEVSKRLRPFKEFLQLPATQLIIESECPGLARKLNRLASRPQETRGRKSKSREERRPIHV